MPVSKKLSFTFLVLQEHPYGREMLRILLGSGRYSGEEIRAWREAAAFEACLEATQGEMEWMDRVAEEAASHAR